MLAGKHFTQHNEAKTQCIIHFHCNIMEPPFDFYCLFPEVDGVSFKQQSAVLDRAPRTFDRVRWGALETPAVTDI